MRFGLVGTGFWARNVHATALDVTADVTFEGIWGRDMLAAQSLAGDYDATAYESFDKMLDAVEAVAFAVPPDIQATKAIQAARRGKHLLLDKPLATGRELADELAEAVTSSGVTTTVFFTARFQPEVASWLDRTMRQEWSSVEASWICSAFEAGSPFADSPWRREKGALWDVGPHALSIVLPLLGPVSGVTGRRGHGDLVHLVLEHQSGATSTLNLTLAAPRTASDIRLEAWGAEGRESMPESITPPADALQTALEELVQLAGRGQTTHPCDATFGRYVVEVLDRAEKCLQPR